MKAYKRGEKPEVERLKRDVSERLHKVCAGWSAAEKEALVQKIVQNELMFPSGRLMADIILERDLARFTTSVPGKRKGTTRGGTVRG